MKLKQRSVQEVELKEEIQRPRSLLTSAEVSAAVEALRKLFPEASISLEADSFGVIWFAVDRYHVGNMVYTGNIPADFLRARLIQHFNQYFPNLNEAELEAAADRFLSNQDEDELWRRTLAFQRRAAAFEICLVEFAAPIYEALGLEFKARTQEFAHWEATPEMVSKEEPGPVFRLVDVELKGGVVTQKALQKRGAKKGKAKSRKAVAGDQKQRERLNLIERQILKLLNAGISEDTITQVMIAGGMGKSTKTVSRWLEGTTLREIMSRVATGRRI